MRLEKEELKGQQKLLKKAALFTVLDGFRPGTFHNVISAAACMEMCFIPGRSRLQARRSRLRLNFIRHPTHPRRSKPLAT